MAKITTVCGDIAPDQLGFTTMHDHTFIDLSVSGAYMESMFPGIPQEMVRFVPENYGFLKSGTYLMCKELQVVDDLEGMAKEYGYFAALGGKSVCDPAPSTARGDVRKMRALSEKTGLNIICATGIYHEAAIAEDMRNRDTGFYYHFCKDEIEKGIDGTDVHPGLLKAALATGSETETAVLEACVRLSAETGMSVHVHTEPTMDGDEILDLLNATTKKYGVDPGRVVVCHMDNRIACGVMVGDYLEDPDVDRTLDLTIQKALLGQGYNIGLDTWGMPVVNPNFFMPDDFERMKALVTLIDLGYAGQITLGNDFSSKLMWRAYGGFGCTRFEEYALPLLEQLGREEAVKKLVYENPTRILAY